MASCRPSLCALLFPLLLALPLPYQPRFGRLPRPTSPTLTIIRSYDDSSPVPWKTCSASTQSVGAASREQVYRGQVRNLDGRKGCLPDRYSEQGPVRLFSPSSRIRLCPVLMLLVCTRRTPGRGESKEVIADGKQTLEVRVPDKAINKTATPTPSGLVGLKHQQPRPALTPRSALRRDVPPPYTPMNLAPLPIIPMHPPRNAPQQQYAPSPAVYGLGNTSIRIGALYPAGPVPAHPQTVFPSVLAASEALRINLGLEIGHQQPQQQSLRALPPQLPAMQLGLMPANADQAKCAPPLASPFHLTFNNLKLGPDAPAVPRGTAPTASPAGKDSPPSIQAQLLSSMYPMPGQVQPAYSQNPQLPPV